MGGQRFPCSPAAACVLALLAPWRGGALGVFRSSRLLDAAEGPRAAAPTPGGNRPQPSIAWASAASGANRSLTPLLDDALLWQKDIFDHPKARNAGAAIFGSASTADWMILLGTVLALALLDFCVVQRCSAAWGSENGRTRGHVAVLVFWVLLGMAFNGLVWWRRGRQAGFMWCSGYFLEWLLSMDNLFVFHLIFQSYKTPRELLHKALFLGVLGAAVFRMCFFMALSSLLHLVHWIRFVFGVLLIYSGIQAAAGDAEEEPDLGDTFVVRGLRRLLGTRLSERYDVQGQRLFVTENGQFRATMLVPVIACLEATDILFAVDSVSAKVAQIPDYYIAYSSSVLAIFGLRAMFFIIQDLVDSFELMKYALCFILVFIGLELMVSDFVQLPSQAVCAIILSIFVVAVAGSTARGLIKSTEDGNAAAPEAAPEAQPGSIKG